MVKKFWFDMDGTITNLYKVDGWLSMLEAEDVTPYVVAEPMEYIGEIIGACQEAIGKGWEIGVVTWGSKNASPEYHKMIKQAKKDWLDKIGFPYSEFIYTAYGINKASVTIDGILIDDNADVCEMWYLSGRNYIGADVEHITNTIKRLIAD